MSKVISIDYEKCVGCRTCMQVCSTRQTGAFNQLYSSIETIRRNLGLENFPIVCQQCTPAACSAICPVKAISRDDLLGRMQINYTRCIGCRMCVAVCPFGAMNFNVMSNKVFKCDLCDGDPLCVRFCQHDALDYVDAIEQSTLKRAETAEKISGIMHKIASAMASAE